MNKKHLGILLVLALTAALLSGCGGANQSAAPTAEPTAAPTAEPTAEPTENPANLPATEADDIAAEEESTYRSSKTSASFTNAYGTPTTKCAHPGCNNYIASSGDTNCCPAHSNRCLNCGKYIDGDAMYCMSCLESSLTSGSSSSSGKSSYSSSGSGYSSGKSSYSSSSSSHSSSGNIGEGGYEMPNEGESFSDYVKRVAPDVYGDLFQ